MVLSCDPFLSSANLTLLVLDKDALMNFKRLLHWIHFGMYTANCSWHLQGAHVDIFTTSKCRPFTGHNCKSLPHLAEPCAHVAYFPMSTLITDDWLQFFCGIRIHYSDVFSRLCEVMHNIVQFPRPLFALVIALPFMDGQITPRLLVLLNENCWWLRYIFGIAQNCSLPALWICRPFVE